MLYIAEIGQQKQAAGEVGTLITEPPPLETAELETLTHLTLASSFDWFSSQQATRFDALFLPLHFQVPAHLESTAVVKWSQFLAEALQLRLPWLEAMAATLDGNQLVLPGRRRGVNPPRRGGPYEHPAQVRRVPGTAAVLRLRGPDIHRFGVGVDWNYQIATSTNWGDQALFWLPVKALQRMELWWYCLR